MLFRLRIQHVGPAREGSDLRMVESKSDDSASNYNGISELSHSVFPH
jgi:hypothetical protein